MPKREIGEWTTSPDGTQTARLRAPLLKRVFSVTLYPRTYCSLEDVPRYVADREDHFKKYHRSHSFSIKGEMSGLVFDTNSDPDGTLAVWNELQKYY